MKKLYVALAAVLCSAAGFSQRAGNQTLPQFSLEEHHIAMPDVRPQSNANRAGVTVWSSDFSTPSDWVIDNDGQTAATFGWDIDNTEQTWAFSSVIASTSGGNFAELNNGNPQAGTQALDVTYTLTTAAPIDINALAGTDFVTLDYQQYGARFNDAQEVYISTNGTTWQLVDDNSDKSVLSQSGGSAYANATQESINLQPFIAGNSSSVWIRFSWTTAFPGSASNPNVWVTYGWMIDDVAIVTSPSNELEIVSGKMGTIDQIWGDLIYYTKYPDEQVQPVRFATEILNSGASVETNVNFSVDVMNSAMSSVFTGTGTGAATLPQTDTLRDTSATAFTPGATLDTYTATYTLTYANVGSDDDPSNNTFDAGSFSVVDREFARDADVFSGGGLWNQDDGAGNANPFILASEFSVATNQNLQRVRVALSDDTQPGAVIYPYIIEIDLAAADFQSLFANVIYDGSQIFGGDYTVASGDISSSTATTWLDLPLANCLTLEGGKTYAIGVGSLGGAQVRIQDGVINPADATVFLYDAVGQNNGNIQWFWTDNTPCIRAVMGVCEVGIQEEETGIALGQNYPNPFDVDTRIDYSIANSGHVTFEVVDVTGKVVFFQDMGTVGAGDYSMTLAGETLKPGAYYYTLSVNDSRVTKRMVVTK